MNKAIRLAVIALLALTAAAPKSRAAVKEYLFVETYLQLAPAAFHLTSEYFGIKSTHSLAHKAIASASSFAIQTAVCYVIKHSFKEMRPDGSSRNSFPSAHTAAAFTGAELIRRDLGWGYGGARLRLRSRSGGRASHTQEALVVGHGRGSGHRHHQRGTRMQDSGGHRH